jgi:hypothetical protein
MVLGMVSAHVLQWLCRGSLHLSCLPFGLLSFPFAFSKTSVSGLFLRLAFMTSKF